MNPNIIKRIDTFKDCIDLRAKYNELYEGDDFNVSEYYLNNIGQIWIFMKLVYTTYYGEDTYNYLGSLMYLEGDYSKVNMNSVIEVSYSYGTNYYGYVTTLNAVAHNLDGSDTVIFDRNDLYGGAQDVRFYICGCSTEEIRAGYCCINCCNIAKEIKDYYENIIS